jgi:hypothetical protein
MLRAMKQTFSRLAYALFLPALLAFTACGDDDMGDDTGDDSMTVDAGPADASPACEEAKSHSDFGWLYTNVFAFSCGQFSSCHPATGNAKAGLSLVDGNGISAYDELLQPATLAKAGGKNRVEPGNCQESWMYNLVSGMNTNGAPRMPTSGPLCQEKIDAICRWIEAGAMKN